MGDSYRRHRHEFPLRTSWRPARGGGYVQFIDGYEPCTCGMTYWQHIAKQSTVTDAIAWGLRYLRARYGSPQRAVPSAMWKSSSLRSETPSEKPSGERTTESR